MTYVFKKAKIIRVTSSFADGSVNVNPTGPVEDQTQKLISSTVMFEEEVLHGGQLTFRRTRRG